MENKSTRTPRNRKRSTPGRAVGTPAELQGASTGDTPASAGGLQAGADPGGGLGLASTGADRPATPPPAFGGEASGEDALGDESALAGETALGADDELAGAEPVVVAERVTIVSETPLDLGGAPIAAEQRYLMIRERAYVYAAERNFEPGGELEDWLRAEREIDAQLGQGEAGGDDRSGAGG